MVRRIVVLSMLILAVSFVACKKDDGKKSESSETIKEAIVEAQAYEKWVYFSFSKGEVVEVSDFQNDLSWDIGFHRMDVRTNSGLSGKGKGGAFMTRVEELSEVKEIPGASEFTIDDKPHPVRVFFNMMEKKWKDVLQPVNYAMTTCIYKVAQNADGKWILQPKMKDGEVVKNAEGKVEYEQLEQPTEGVITIDMRDMNQGGPTYKINPKVYIVRCADGQFAKIKVVDYLDEKNKSGVWKLNYEYPVK